MGPLCENMMPSTKPEVHNVLNAAKGGPSYIATGNMHREFGGSLDMWFLEGRFVYAVAARQTDGRTDRQTGRHQTDADTMLKTS